MASFTSFDGVGIAYREWPADSDLPPVLLHHGFASSGAGNWEQPGVVAALVASGRRVLTIDARGHGDSDKPHDSERYGEGTMARDVALLLDTLAITTVDLVGYSMGAIVSTIVATQEPRVRRLVIGGIGAGVVEMGGVDRRALAPTALVEALKADDPSTITNAPAAAFRAFADASGGDRLALAAQAGAVHSTRIPLEQISAPTLLVVGDADPLSARPEVLVNAITGAELRVVAGDHLMAVGNPDFVNAIVEFVNR